MTDPYVLVRERARELGLDPVSPSEWAPFKMRCPAVEGHGRSVVVTDGIDGRAVFDCDKGCKAEAIYKAMNLTWKDVGPPLPEKQDLKQAHREFVWTSMADIKPRPVRWLWHPYFPLGKVSLVVGAPGHGKSQLTAWLTAATTSGAFYNGDVEVASDALMIFAEDDADDTVVPRLIAAGADVRRVSTVNAREHYGFDLTADGLIRLPGDIGVLYKRLEAHPEARLLIFDPVMSHLGREYKGVVGQDVRDAVGPLKALAAKFNVAVVLILHVNKQSEIKEWAARISDSHAWQAIARSIVALGPDPDDPEGDEGSLKILALPKSNLLKRVGRSSRFRIVSADVPTDHGIAHTSYIELLGPCDVSADDLLMSNEQRTTRHEAREFVEDFLGDEWHKVGDLKSAAIKEGHSWRTIERIRRDACRKPQRQGGAKGAWWVALTSTRTPPPWAQGTGGLDGLSGDKAATPPTPPVPGVEDDGLTPNGRQDRQALDLEAYRRQRDAMLGERWEDEE